MDFEKWLPLAGIGVLAYLAISKIASNQPQSIVRGFNYSSRVVPSPASSVDKSGFQGVVDVAKAQIASNDKRAQYANALELESIKQQGLNARANYQLVAVDKQLSQISQNQANQNDALSRYYAAQSSSQNRGFLYSSIGQLLNSLLRGTGSNAQGGKSLPGTPPFNPSGGMIQRNPPQLRRNNTIRDGSALSNYYWRTFDNLQNSPVDYEPSFDFGNLSFETEIFSPLDLGNLPESDYPTLNWEE